MKPRRSFGSKRVSRANHRVSLQSVLLCREDLDGLNPESLARSHGLPLAEVEKAIAAERVKRDRAA